MLNREYPVHIEMLSIVKLLFQGMFGPAELKQMKALRTTFTRLTNTDSWEAAQELYPQFADDEQLRRYVHVDLKKAIPQSFADLCQRVKTSNVENVVANNSLCVHHGTVSAIIIELHSIIEVSGQRILRSDSSFRGANLVMATTEDVSISGLG